MTKTKVQKTVKAYAVLGYPDDKPMQFGTLAKSFKGSLSIFENKEDALKMKGDVSSWRVVPCKIIY